MFEVSSVALRNPLPTTGRRRRPLLASAAVAAALLAVATAGPVRAQSAADSLGSYRGTVTSSIGATVTNVGDTRTNINVTATSALIDWTPTNTGPVLVNGVPTLPAAIAFQPAGTNAVFAGQGQDYTVLNRINTGTDGRPVSFNGVTTSYLGTEAAGARGGNIWFYSPGGILVGATGRFDVGSLVLSASRIQAIETGYGVSFGAPGTISFLDSMPNAAVTLQPGAQVNLTRQNSYLAIVAPRVVQGGTVDVNGTVGYVAAEAATISIANNLFDITVTTGTNAAAVPGETTDPAGNIVLRHSGTTTGYGATQGNPHAIYMVAVPKNQAITMLVTGNVGYRGAALDATVQNGTVVLSGGANVDSTAEIGTGFTRAAAALTLPAPVTAGTSLAIQNANFTSGVIGFASQATNVRAGPNASVTFNGNADLSGGALAEASAVTGGTLLARGSLTLTGAGIQALTARTPGQASVNAAGGTITAQRTLAVIASNGAGSGGTAQILASNSGTVAVTGATTISATGTSATTGGAVTGGTALVSATQGRITLTGGTTIDVTGRGTNSATARGGSATITADAGAVTIGGTTISANAGTGYGASATGGTVTLQTLAGKTAPTGVTPGLALGTTSIGATAAGGGNPAAGGTGGAGTGGTVTLSAAQGSITTGEGSFSADVGAAGGSGRTNAAGATAGGVGTGGTITLTAAGAGIQLDTATLSASGTGGNGGTAFAPSATTTLATGGAGGLGKGGTITIGASDGAIGFGGDYAILRADGAGGNGGGTNQGAAGNGGAGMGGTIGLTATRAPAATAPGTITVAGGLGISTGGIGGAGASHDAGSTQPAGNGGSGTGGTITLLADSGATIRTTSTYLLANGGGNGGGSAEIGYGQAGSGLGGTITVTGAGAATLALGATVLTANGGGFFERIGPSRGGTIGFDGAGASVSIASLAAEAMGGTQFDTNELQFPFGPTSYFRPANSGAGASAPAVGGTVQGGTISAGFGGGFSLADYGTISLSAGATGYGLPTTGGLASLTFAGSTATVSSIQLNAAATPGPFDSGAAQGGSASLTVTAGSTIGVTNGVALDASGNANGSFSNGGASAATPGAGGTATLSVLGSLTTSSDITLNASGSGADTQIGVDAGSGMGGRATVIVDAGGSLVAPRLNIDATATGGESFGQYVVDYANTRPAAGGDATGGTALVQIGTGTLQLSSPLTLDTRAYGGASGSAGRGGNATGGNAGFEAGYGGGVSTVSLPELNLYAIGIGGSQVEDGYGFGNGGIGGRGTGGTAAIALSGEAMTLGTLLADASGRGGAGGIANAVGIANDGGAGGAGIGGSATVTIGTALTANDILVSGTGAGGAGGDSNAGIGGNGGAGTGVLASLRVTANVNASSIRVDAGGTGAGTGAALSEGTTGISLGGAATGGTASLTGTDSDITTPSVEIVAGGTGGRVDPIQPAGVPDFAPFAAGDTTGYGNVTGGAATGGTTSIQLTNTTLATSLLTVDGSATGAAAQGTGSGGNAIGGGATISVVDGGLSVNEIFTLTARATGGDGTVLAGFGRGGTASLTTGTLADPDAPLGPTVSIGPDVVADAAGAGGLTGDTGAGAAGTGGTARFDIGAGTTTLGGTLTLDASGTGSASALATIAAGGAGRGGSAGASVGSGALLDIASTTLFDARGTGAQGAGGGAGTGGTASLVATNGSVTIGDTLSLLAQGAGGIGRAGADGGAGQGGTITMSVAGADGLPAALTATQLAANANGNGGAVTTDNATTGGRSGGSGTGGTIALGISDARLAPGAATLTATGRGADGYTSVIGGSGGSGTGGTVTLLSGTAPATTDTTTAIDFDSLTIDVRAFGGGGVGYGVSQGASGGSALSGTAAITLGAGTLTTSGIVISGEATAQSGLTPDDTTTRPGGNGGDARGAAITLAANGGTFNVTSISTTGAATAGNGGSGTSGGRGGSATGGSLTLSAANGSSPDFTGVTFSLDATAGNGGDSRVGSATNAAGAGGIARGGTFAVSATGYGSSIALPAPVIALNARGGNGGLGADGVNGSAGGSAGTATGGTVRFSAIDGGAITLGNSDGTGPTITLNAQGGTGGSGGNGSGYGNTGGAGGDSGIASGGTVEFIATGGTIDIGSLAVVASGYGGLPGGGGSGTTRPGVPGVPGTPGDPTAMPPIPPTAGTPGIPEIPGVSAPQGFFGDSAGGTVRFTLNDATDAVPADLALPGAIRAGGITTTLSAFDGPPESPNIYGYAGLVEIANQSMRDKGRIDLGTLNLTAEGTFGQRNDGSSFRVLANDAIVHIAGGTVNVAGSADIAAAGGGRLDVDNDLSVTADLTYIGYALPGSAIETDTIRSNANLLFNTNYFQASGDATLRAADTITVNSEGSLNAFGTLVASNAVTLRAAGGMTVNNVLADAPVVAGSTGYGTTATGGTVTLVSGGGGYGGTLRNAAVEITGTVRSTLRTDVTAGGTVRVDSGGTLSSDNLVAVQAGDDIIVTGGGAIRGATDPYEDGGAAFETSVGSSGVTLRAGGLGLDYALANNVSSIILGGTVDAGERALSLRAGGTLDTDGTSRQPGAVVALGEPIVARSLIITIDGAAPVGDPRDDTGKLPTGCFAGSVCLGQVNTTRTLLIDAADGGDATPTRVSIAGSTANDQTIIRATDTISFGVQDLEQPPVTIVGRDLLRIQSRGGQIALTPGTTLQGGNGGGSFGGLVQIGGATGIGGAGATIDGLGGPVGFYTGSGDLTLGTLRAGSVDTLDAALGTVSTGTLNIAGGIDIDQVALADTDIDFTGGGAVRVGSATTPGAVRLTSTGGGVTLNETPSTVSAITLTGQSVSFGTIAAAGDITAAAGSGDIVGGFASAGGDIRATGSGTINIERAEADGLLSAETTGSVLLGFGRGTGGINLNGSYVQADTLQGGGVFARSTGDLSIGTVDAIGDITFDVDGSILATALTTSAATGYGGSGAISLRAGGNLTIDTFADAAGGIGLQAESGSATGGSLTARNGALQIDAGADVRFAGPLAASQIVRIGAGQTIAVGTITSDSAPDAQFGVSLDGTDVGTGTVTASNAILLSARNSITGTGTLTAPDAVLALAGQDVTLGDVQTNGLFYLGNRSVLDQFDGEDRTAITATLATGAPAATRGFAALGNMIATGTTFVTAGTDVTFGTLTGTGTLRIGSAGGGIAGTSLATPGDVLLAAGGDTGFTSVSAANVSANALGGIGIGTIAATTDIRLQAGGAFTATTVQAGDDIDVVAGSAAIGSATATGSGSDATDIALLDIPAPAPAPGPTPLFAPFAASGARIAAVSPVRTPPALVEQAAVGPLGGADIRISGADAVNLTTGDATGSIVLASSAGGITSSTLRANALIDARGFGGLTLGQATAGSAITLFGAAGGIGATTLDAETGIDARAAGSIALGTATTRGPFYALTQDAFSADTVDARGNIDVIAYNDITADDLYSNANINLTSQANVAIDDVATGAVTGPGGGAGGSITVNALGDVVLGTADADVNVTVDAGGNVDIGYGIAGGQIVVRADGSIGLANGLANDAILLTAGGGITSDTLLTQAAGGSAGGAIRLGAGGAIALGDATAAGDLSVVSSAGSVRATRLLRAARSVVVTGSGGNVTLADVTAGTTLALTAGADPRSVASTPYALTTGVLTAGGAATLRATGGIATGNVTAASLDAGAGGTIALGAITVGGGFTATSDTGGIALTNATASGIALTARNGTVRGTGTLVSSADFTIDAGAIDIAAARATGQFTATSRQGNILLGTLDAGSIRLTSAGGVTIGANSTQRDFIVSAVNAFSADRIAAPRDVAINAAGGLTIGEAIAGRDLTLATAAALGLGTGRAGGDIVLNGGTVTIDSVVGTGLGEDRDMGSGGDGVGNVRITSAGTTRIGSADAAGVLAIDSTGSITGFTGLTGTRAVNVATRGGIAGGTIASRGSSLSITATGDVSLDTARAAAGLTATGGTLAVTTAAAGSGLSFTARGSISIGTLTAGADARATTTAGSVAIGTATVGAGFTIDANGTGANVRIGETRAGTADFAADGTATLTGALVTTNGNATVQAVGDVNGNAITSVGGIGVQSGSGAITLAALNAGTTTNLGGIALAAATRVIAGNARAIGSVTASGTAGAVTLGETESVGGTVRVAAGGDLAIGNVRAAGSIFLTGGGAISSRDLTAGTGPLLAGGGGSSTGGGVDLATAGIAPGFDDTAIVRCDDCSTSLVPLPFSVNYFGDTYAGTFVSNNGYLTFNSGQGTFTPEGLGASYRGQPIIAAFFADVDTRNTGSAQVRYGPGTFAGREAFGATYENVGYFNNQADKLNSFQIILTNRADTGTGNFDIYYNYTNISWETGSASNGVNGFGGISAAVGYNAGNGNAAGSFYELPGSRVPGSFLNNGPSALVTKTNNNIPGQMLFTVRNGQVSVGGGSEPPTVHVTNLAAGNSAAVNLGNISAEGVEVHGAGSVTVGDVAVGDRGSGIEGAGQRYATVIDGTTDVVTGNIASTGLIALGATLGNLTAGTIDTAGSAVVLSDGAVVLGAVNTGLGANDTLFVASPGGAGNGGLTGFDFDTLLSGRTFDPATLASSVPIRGGTTFDLMTLVNTGNFIAAGNLLGVADVTATNRIAIIGTGDLTVTRAVSGGAIDLRSANGSLILGRLASGITAPVGTTPGIITLRAANDVRASGTIDAGNRLTVTADTGAIALADAVRASRDLILAAARTITTAAVTAGGSIGATSSEGTVSLGASDAGTDLTVSGASLTLAAARAGRNIALTSPGAITTAALTAGGSIGAASTNGAVSLGATDAGSDLTVTGGSLTLATARAGRNIALTSPGAITTAALTAGGSINAASTNGTVSLGASNAGTDLTVSGASLTLAAARAGRNITLTAPGTITTAGLIAGGSLTITSSGSGLSLGVTDVGTDLILSGTSLTLAAARAGRDIVLTSPGAITTAALNAGGSIAATSSGGAVSLGVSDAGTDLTAAGASLTLAAARAGRNIALTSPGAITTAALTAGGSLAATSTGGAVSLGDSIAGTDLTVSGNALTLTSASAGDDLALTSREAIVATRLVTRAVAGSDAENDGSRIVATATGPITIDQISGAGTVALGAGGALQVATDLAAAGSVTAGGSTIVLTARGPLTIASATATGGGVTLTSAGDLSVAAARAPGSILLTSSAGAVSLGDASTQASNATGRGDVIVRAATNAALTGTVDARDDVLVTAGQLARIAGSALGNRIALTSADVAIGSGARIGRGLGTSEVVFTNGSTANATYLGTNTGGTGGYALDTAELGTVAARTIRIVTPTTLAGATPEVTIGDLALTGSAGTQATRLYGDASGLSIETPGRIHVIGNVALSNVATGDTLTLNAGRVLDVVTPSGSIQLSGTGGTPAGRLVLAGDQILVTSQSAATDLATLTTTDARDARLAQVDGTARSEGYLGAGGIEFRVGSALYVQNSGAAVEAGSTSRGGFTAGAGGVTIATTGTAPAVVIVNGRIANADGSFTSGAALVPSLVLRGSTTQTMASLDARSTANGCLITGVSCNFVTPVTPAPDIFPVQDTIQEALDPIQEIGDPSEGITRRDVPLIEEPDFATYTVSSTIDEPVTGAGNDDLYATPDCVDPNDTTCAQGGTPSPLPGPAPTAPPTGPEAPPPAS